MLVYFEAMTEISNTNYRFQRVGNGENPAK